MTSGRVPSGKARHQGFQKIPIGLSFAKKRRARAVKTQSG